MRTIIVVVFLIASCNWQSGDVDGNSISDASTTTIDALGDVVAPSASEVVATPVTSTIESQTLKPLSVQEVTALADANDDIAGLVIDRRKAYRMWLRTSKIGVALTKAREARDAMIAAMGKARERKLECLVELFGKQLDDAEARARACGPGQWAIAANGGVVGGK